MAHFKIIGLCGTLLLVSIGTRAQHYSPLSKLALADYNQLADDSASFRSYRPTISNYNSEKWELLELETGSSVNSGYARSYNDGPLWQGKGVTAYLSGGLQKKFKQLHVTLNPVLYYSQNTAFQLQPQVSNNNEFEYQFSYLGFNVDYVQRFGDKSFAEFHPGQSELAWRGKNLEAGVSTQNFTLGPATFQTILMSNGAPGFPHFNFGSSRPIPITLPLSKLRWRDVGLGKFDFQVFYGILTESDYFDTKNLHKHQYLNGMTAGYQLPGLENITIGINRVLYKNGKYLDSNDWYSFLRSKERVNASKLTSDSLSYRAFDQLVGLFINLKVPESDFRFYFELAKNDFNGSIRNFLEELEHTRAYTVGVEKIYPVKNRNLHIHFEQTNLIGSGSYRYRAQAPYYTHTIALQGYTNQGQLLGAGIGPGSATEQLHLNLFKASDFFGVNFQRIRFNEDYFNKIIPISLYKYQLHDVEYSIGLKAFRSFKRFDLLASGTWSYRLNMHNIEGNDKQNLGANLVVYIPLSE